MHENAFGHGIDYDNIGLFTKYANSTLSPADFENCYIVDYILDARDDNYELLGTLGRYPEYFGNQIDKITIVVENISLESIQLMGADKDSIKINFNGIDYVRFKDTKFIEEVMSNRLKELTIKGSVNLNTWGGRTTVQCFIEDYEFKCDDHKYDF